MRGRVKWSSGTSIPETGCPFWLEYASNLDWDPSTEVQTYDDLDRFGFFQDEWLRGGPVRRWVPKAYADRPIYIFETGGSTGVPKSRITIDDFRIDYEAFSDELPDDAFPKGADWIMVGPSGPRRLRLAVEHLAQHRGGICFMTDLDPRWVIKLIKRGKIDEAEALQAARGGTGAHAAARARRHTLHVHDAEAARGDLREDIAEESGNHGRFLRRHGNDAAVPPLRG